MDQVNPCLLCGACCAYYRVSFYWAEADDATPGGVPAAMTARLGSARRVMIGTNRLPTRCLALTGEIGGPVACTIYAQRPSTCRDFEPSWINGEPNAHCDKARRHWGLPPLEPDAWGSPDPLPHAA